MKKKLTQKKHKPYPESKTVDMFDWMVEQEKDSLDVWETSDYQAIPIVNLRDSHLLSIIGFMDQRPGWRAEQRSRILQEIERRKKLKLAKTSKAGKLFYGIND